MQLPTINTHTFDNYLSSVSRIPQLTAEEEYELAKQYQLTRNIEAAYKLTLHNLRFVVYIAREYTGYNLPLEDLVQEGNTGLMRAVKKFNPDAGVRLVSYAITWIRAEIYNYVTRNWKIVKAVTTKNHRKLFFNLRKYTRNNGAYTDEEITNIANELNVPEKDVRSMEKYLYSHDALVDDLDSHEHNTLIATNSSNPLEQLLINESEFDMDGMLAILNDRERDVIQSRWLNDEKSTLEELGIKYTVSCERIRQIEQAALKKLKKAYNHVDYA